MLGIHISQHAPFNTSNTSEGRNERNESGEMEKRGQGTRVNLQHRQHLAANIHPLSSTLVSVHISVNASAFMNLADEAISEHQREKQTPEAPSVLARHSHNSTSPPAVFERL